MQPSGELRELLERYLQGLATPEEEQYLAGFFEKSGKALPNPELSQADKDRLFAALRMSPRFTGAKQDKNSPAVLEIRGYGRRLPWVRISRIAAIWLMIAGAGGILAMWFYWSGKMKPAETAFLQVHTGTGQIKRITFPDGSEAVLNAGSDLYYHPDFRHHRSIRLQGEARFTVKHMEDYPFTVATAEGLITRDLGTEFVVCDYPQLPDIGIVVMSGKVSVEQNGAVLSNLSPLQGIRYNRSGQQWKSMAAADLRQFTAWETGEWAYSNITTADLQVLLSTQYNVSLINRIAHKKPGAEGLNMNFLKRQTPREIVDMYCLATGYQCKWTDKRTAEIY